MTTSPIESTARDIVHSLAGLAEFKAADDFYHTHHPHQNNSGQIDPKATVQAPTFWAVPAFWAAAETYMGDRGWVCRGSDGNTTDYTKGELTLSVGWEPAGGKLARGFGLISYSLTAAKQKDQP